MSPRGAYAIVAGAILFGTIAWALLPNTAPVEASPIVPRAFGDALWTDRALDVVVQAFLLLAGVLAILLVLQDLPREARDG